MGDSPVTLEFLGRQLTRIQSELRQVRTDIRALMTLVVAQSGWDRQFERRLVQFARRLVDQTDVLVAEFNGRIGISQSMVERRMDDVSERLEELETGRSRFTP